ncbi:MAG: YdeI/OmpD-associated family protein [Solirubrobacterales bacterium]|nr:YdeI/OmpD-associated family protein [Solirubrobacterales bacterium]
MTEELLIHFEDGTQLEAWLETNGEEIDELWVEVYKKHTGVTSLSWTEIVESVLCFGWIDSQKRTIDEDRYKQRLTPRRARSKWSKINREKAEALIAAGRMREAGLAQVELAKADGRWEAAYDSPANSKVPEDFALALKEAGLERAFTELDSQNRFSILHRIQTVKRAETRARKIEEFCAMLERGEKIHP